MLEEKNSWCCTDKMLPLFLMSHVAIPFLPWLTHFTSFRILVPIFPFIFSNNFPLTFNIFISLLCSFIAYRLTVTICVN